MITNERDLTMRSPRPVEGRARGYGYQGPLSDSRLGSRTGGLEHQNSYNYGLVSRRGSRIWIADT